MEYQISVKLDETQNEMIDRLAERYDCNRAEAVRKAVQLAAESGSSAPQLEAKIDAINDSIIELLRLTIDHSGAALDMSKRNLKTSAQAAIYGANIALQLGVRESALQSFENWKKDNAERI